MRFDVDDSRSIGAACGPAVLSAWHDTARGAASVVALPAAALSVLRWAAVRRIPEGAVLPDSMAAIPPSPEPGQPCLHTAAAAQLAVVTQAATAVAAVGRK